MRRALIQIWGTKGHKSVGQKLVLWSNPIVIWGGKEAGGIEILKASGIDKPEKVKLVVTRGKNRTIIIDPIIEKPKNALTDEAFQGFSDRLMCAETMPALSKIGKEIKDGYFDDTGASRLASVYKEAVKAVRGLSEKEG